MVHFNHPVTELAWLLLPPGTYARFYPPRELPPYVRRNKQYLTENIKTMSLEDSLLYLKDLLLSQREYSTDIRCLIKRIERKLVTRQP